MTQETALVKSDNLPATFEEVTGLAKAFVTSGYFTDTRQLAQDIVKIQAGRELGIPPVYAMQNINLIRNRLCSSANTLALLVKRSGKYNYRIKEHTDTLCLITFYETEAGKWVEIGESKFTIEDAQRAELVKPDSGWVKYPRAMLFSRAISQGARIYCPDAIGGMYTDEEMTAIPKVVEGEHGKTELEPPPPLEIPPDAPGGQKQAVKDDSHTIPPRKDLEAQLFRQSDDLIKMKVWTDGERQRVLRTLGAKGQTITAAIASLSDMDLLGFQKIVMDKLKEAKP